MPGERFMASIQIREMVLGDVLQVSRLLEELGYPNSSDFVHHKIEILETSGSDEVYIAEADGQVVAFAHLHQAELFHAPGRLGRVMALAVAEGSRRQGIGQRLMAAVERRASEGGCVMMEVSSGVHRPGAHEFYQKLGYIEEPKRFVKVLGDQK